MDLWHFGEYLGVLPGSCFLFSFQAGTDGVPEANQRVHNGHGCKQPCCPWVSRRARRWSCQWQQQFLQPEISWNLHKRDCNDTRMDLMSYVDWCLLIVCRLRHRFTSFTPVFISSLPMFGSELAVNIRNDIRSWMEFLTSKPDFTVKSPWNEIVWLDKVNQWDTSDCIPRFYVNLRRLNGYPGRASAASSRRDSAHSRGLNRVTWNDVKTSGHQ